MVMAKGNELGMESGWSHPCYLVANGSPKLPLDLAKQGFPITTRTDKVQ
jgi:hypothetical protein